MPPRPLAVAALDDKIVQRAVTMVLRIERKKVTWILDADIRSFFNEVSR
ncbi:hypothetical protein [Methylocystis iwaonis]|nr:hypothetical protein [Methylocystis iwaonis]